MEVLTVNKGDTLGDIADARGLKGKKKEAFISSVMKQIGITDARKLQIGKYELSDSIAFDQEAEAFAKLEKSSTDSDKKEKAPKLTIGQRFVNWEQASTTESVKVHDITSAWLAKRSANGTPEDTKIRIGVAKEEVNERIKDVSEFSFTGSAYKKAIASGDMEAARVAYLKDLDKFATSYIKKVDPNGGGSISKEAFVAHDVEFTHKTGLNTNYVTSEKIFATLDRDKNGQLSPDEIKGWFAAMNYSSQSNFNGKIAFSDYTKTRSQLIGNKKSNISAKLDGMGKYLKAGMVEPKDEKKQTEPETKIKEQLLAAKEEAELQQV